MNFQIIYHSNGSNIIRYSNTAQAACIAAYNHMILHSNIDQATIIDLTSGEVIRTYMR